MVTNFGSSYIHTAWATDGNGTNFNTSEFDGATWVGTLTDANSAATAAANAGETATGFTLKYQSSIARNPAYVNWIAVLDDNSKSDSGE